MSVAATVPAVLERSLRAQGLFGQRVLAAVSGGADSVALLRGLAELVDRRELTILIGHFDHRLRGAESAADARWVSQLSVQMGFECVLGAAAEPGAVTAAGVEERAREQRYAFLDATAQRTECAAVLTAHTADDQAETVLHHVIRGTGWSGLRGIPGVRELPSGVRLVRPLLGASRVAVEEYLAELGQGYCCDASNGDTSLTRNALRREVLPLLRERFNPQVSGSLNALAELAAETEACLAELSAQCLKAALLQRDECGVSLDRESLATVPSLLLKETLRRLWLQGGWPRRELGRETLERLAAAIRAGGRIPTFDLPDGVRVTGQGGLLRIERVVRNPSKSDMANP